MRPQTLLAAFLLTAISHAFADPSLVADYQFNNDLTSSVAGAPNLVALSAMSPNSYSSATVFGQSKQVRTFTNDGGLQFNDSSNIVPVDHYSIVVDFTLTLGLNEASKILDFNNLTSDTGLYDNNGTSQFYDNAAGTGTGVAVPATYFELALTRTDLGVVTGYVNGVQAFSFSDVGNLTTNNIAVLGGLQAMGATPTLTFFQDDTVSPTETIFGPGVSIENTTGNVSRIQLYNDALSSTQIAALYPAPEPATWVLLTAGALVMAAVVRRQVQRS